MKVLTVPMETAPPKDRQHSKEKYHELSYFTLAPINRYQVGNSWYEITRINNNCKHEVQHAATEEQNLREQSRIYLLLDNRAHEMYGKV